MKMTMEEYKEKSGLEFDLEKVVDFDAVKERIRPRLIGENRGEYLIGKPHKGFLDMSICYYVDLGTVASGETASAIVTDDLLRKWGVDLEEVHKTAVGNLKGWVRPMCEVLRNMGEEVPDQPQMYVVTTEDMHFGAALMLKEDVLEGLYDLLGEGFAIIPSSVHEFLAIPAAMAGGEVIDMIRTINDSVVGEVDRLSYSLYRYTKGDGVTIFNA